MTNRKIRAALACAALALAAAAESPSEISVDLRLDEIDYVAGEKVRGVIDVKNTAPEKVSVGYSNSKDRLIVEIFRASDMSELERVADRPFVAPFRVDSNEGQKLEVLLANHYALTEPRRYLARPVLIHGGMRYEGQYRAFDIVPGIKITGALQMFANREGLSREFSLLHWTRKGHEHIFLAATDHGGADRMWVTSDLGALMRITRPTVSILPNGEVIVLHRTGPDHFIRSEFWSLPDALEFHTRELIQDPETAGQSRVKEMYNKAGGVKPVDRPWWKFW